jgi:hypothetical protein
MPLMLSPAAVVPDSKLRLVIIVFSIPRWSSPSVPFPTFVSPRSTRLYERRKQMILVRDQEVLAIIRAFGENLLPICSL